MGDAQLPLVDVNTEHVEVIQGLQAWITSFVQEYGVDGLRIDGQFLIQSAVMLSERG